MNIKFYCERDLLREGRMGLGATIRRHRAKRLFSKIFFELSVSTRWPFVFVSGARVIPPIAEEYWPYMEETTND